MYFFMILSNSNIKIDFISKRHFGTGGTFMTRDILEQDNFKYKALYNWITEAITKGRFSYGEMLPSEKMLMNKFGVSRQTVRNSMSELSKNGYIERHKGKGTFVTYKNSLMRNKTIGVCLSFLDNYIFPNVLEGIERVLTQEGYGIELGFGKNRVDNEAKFLQRMLDLNVSGLIIEGVKSAMPNPNDHYYRQFLSAGVPVIFVHNYYQNVECPTVVMEDEKMTREITQMLIDAGHRRIAGLFKFDDKQGPFRYLGFIRALMENDIEVMEKYICWYGTYGSTALNKDSFENLELFNKFADDIIGNCTAMVAYNDLVAGAVITRLRSKGYKVPDDISVASYDDSDIMKTFGASLTSVHHPKDKMGVKVAEVLLSYINNPQKNVAIRDFHIVPSTITVRDSIRVIQEA